MLQPKKNSDIAYSDWKGKIITIKCNSPADEMIHYKHGLNHKFRNTTPMHVLFSVDSGTVNLLE